MAHSISSMAFQMHITAWAYQSDMYSSKHEHRLYIVHACKLKAESAGASTLRLLLPLAKTQNQ